MKNKRQISVAASIALSVFIPLTALAVDGNDKKNKVQDVSVVNEPTVKAKQSGAWNVDVNGTVDVKVSGVPDVSVANTESHPVPVKIMNDIPVTVTVNNVAVPLSVTLTRPTQYLVPADKLAVLEFFQVVCDYSAVTPDFGGQLRVFYGSAPIIYPFFMTAPRGGQRYYVLSQSIKLYADPNSVVDFEPNGLGAFYDCKVLLTGELLPVRP